MIDLLVHFYLEGQISMSLDLTDLRNRAWQRLRTPERLGLRSLSISLHYSRNSAGNCSANESGAPAGRVIRAGLRAGDVFAAGHFRTVRLFAAKLKPCLWSDVLLAGACHCCVGVAAMATNDFFAETAIPVGLGVVFTVAILLLSVLF